MKAKIVSTEKENFGIELWRWSISDDRGTVRGRDLEQARCRLSRLSKTGCPEARHLRNKLVTEGLTCLERDCVKQLLVETGY